MANKLNPIRKKTTVAFEKAFINEVRRYAQERKKSKTGTIYETNEEILARIFNEWKQGKNITNPDLHPTYPVRVKTVPSF